MKTKKICAAIASVLSVTATTAHAETTILNVPDHDRVFQHIQMLWGDSALDEMIPCENEDPNRTRLRTVHDEALGKPVFEVSSIAADAGCNTRANRFRSELKSNALNASKGSVTDWQFLIKMASSFEPTSNSFTHLFQAKAEPDANARFRLSSYQRDGGQTLEFNFSDDNNQFQYLCIFGVEAYSEKAKNCEIAEAYKNKEASVLYGRWLDVQINTTWLDNGVLNFKLSDHETGEMIMSYHGELDLWSDKWETMRPKFGIYREQEEFDGSNVTDVSVQFSDIKITRNADLAYIGDGLSLHMPYVNFNGLSLWAQLSYDNAINGWVLNSYGVNSLPVKTESSVVELAPSDLSLSIPKIAEREGNNLYNANLAFSGDANLLQWQLRDYQSIVEEK